MFLMITIVDVFDILKINYKGQVHEALASAGDIDPRTIRRYIKNNKFPESMVCKLSRKFLNNYPINGSIDNEFLAKTHSWIYFIDEQQKAGFEIVPKSFELLKSLANSDLNFYQTIEKEKSKAKRFEKYKNYLTESIIPLYFPEGSTLSKKIMDSIDLNELRNHITRVLLQSLLFLLSHFEAEYLSTNEHYKTSLLGQCVTQETNRLTSHNLLKLWLEGLAVNKQKFVSLMIEEYGDADDADIAPDLPPLSKETWEMHYYLHVEKGHPVTFEKISRWAKGLYAGLSQQQKHEVSPNSYVYFATEVFGGALFLDQIIKESRPHTTSKHTSFNVSNTYQSLYIHNRKRLQIKPAI